MATNQSRRRVAVGLVSAAACFALAAPTAASVIKFPPTRGPFLFAASTEPTGTTGREPQPVKLDLGVGFLTADAAAESQAGDQLVFGLDRNLTVSVDGLPSCNPRIQIQAGPGGDLFHRCKPALLGEGHARLSFPQEDGSLTTTHSKALLYNGGAQDGAPRLWLYLSLEWPVPGGVFSPIDLRPSVRAAYGEEAVWQIPKIAGGQGFISLLELHIGRSYADHGERRSVLALSCPRSQEIRFSAELLRPDGSAGRVRPLSETCGASEGKHLMSGG
jgi:hypothetical protein